MCAICGIRNALIGRRLGRLERTLLDFGDAKFHLFFLVVVRLRLVVVRLRRAAVVVRLLLPLFILLSVSAKRALRPVTPPFFAIERNFDFGIF